jgi:arylsulfatase A-like enzyme
MVRTEKYKLIVYPTAKKIRLYDIENDPEELNDLAENPDYSKVVAELAGRLKNQQKIMDDPLDLHHVFSDIFSE